MREYSVLACVPGAESELNFSILPFQLSFQFPNRLLPFLTGFEAGPITY